MCDAPERKLQTSHSYFETQSPKDIDHGNGCKSEINVVKNNEYSFTTLTHRFRDNYFHASSFAEYYKKYDHDELPVKDISAVGDKGSLTNSELDQLEMKIFKNMSQELQTDDSSNASLESNIKFFKTTVQEIFDNFYASMRDYEVYKKRFNDILAKNREDAVADMEDFIKDMIQHIMISESSSSDEFRKSAEVSSTDVVDKETNITNDEPASIITNTSEMTQSVIESYKNDNYLTDSTLDDCSNKIKRPSIKEDTYNIFLLSDSPCVEIKMNDRNLVSEINIKRTYDNKEEGKPVASAENMKSLAAKKLELQQYIEHEQEPNDLDQDIPVKVSYAKKDIHLDEDFISERECEKSLISKICSFICRRFRKST